jgi:2-dehydro-3-deoxygluconokinase
LTKTVVTFGEIMGRLCPSGFLRFKQACPGNLEMTFAGAEANVAASICMLGGNARFVTALPDHDISIACLSQLKGLGIDTSAILIRDVGRLGLYFVEAGANQRPSNVIYDRAGSTVSLTDSDCYDWERIFTGACWFHVSGITPALSQAAATAAITAVTAAKKAGITVSCDLNFRKKLWRWDESLEPKQLAQKSMRQLLPYVDVVIGNEEDAFDVLGIKAGESDVESGQLDIDKYPQVARKIVRQFGNVSKVSITLRESISASHNNWGAMLYDTKQDNAWMAPMIDGTYYPYKIKNIVDRVGGGDAFSAGLIFALNDNDLNQNETALSFAVASSCLAHSISADFNYSSREEVEKLMTGSGTGRVVR